MIELEANGWMVWARIICKGFEMANQNITQQWTLGWWLRWTLDQIGWFKLTDYNTYINSLDSKVLHDSAI